VRVEVDRLAAEALAEAEALAADGLLVGLVAGAEHVALLEKAARGNAEVGLLERDGMHRRITLVEATAAKGLEFDAVVVVEPSALAGADARGLRLLYVAMTRPIQQLSIIHAAPLPSPLAA
jgi:superfamily I DNA/RNA helicase